MPGIAQALVCHGGGGGTAPLPTLSLVFIDGSEHVAEGDDKWKGATYNSAPASAVAGAHGKVYDDSVWDAKVVSITGVSTLTVKARVRFRVLGDEEFIALRNSSTSHIQVELTSAGNLQVRAGGGAFTHVTSGTYSIDTWYEIELRAVIHDSAGEYTLTVDGVVPNKSGGGTMSQTGLDTRNGATTTVDNWRLGGGNTIESYTDDQAIDSAGNSIGLGQVETLTVTSAGDLTEMTPSAGSNFQCVDEATQNGDTDFVSNAASAKRDCYNVTDRSVVGTPRAVQVTATAKLTSGTPTFKNFLRIGGVNYDGATTHTATSAYKCYVQVWNTNPATGLAWTDSDISSLQPGFLAIDANLRLTQIVVEVWVTT